MTPKAALSAAILIASFGALSAAARSVVGFNSAWEFSKDGGAPRRVDLPHDWAVDGGFTLDVAGCEGHLPYPGVGIYRKSFATPKDLTDGGQLWLEIDGAMNHSSVRLNGQLVSPDRPFGYISYKVDLTPALKPKGAQNDLEIHLDVPVKSSRYYSGAGLFRDVRLVTVAKSHIAYNGVCVRTETLKDGSAKVKVAVEAEGPNEGLECRSRKDGKLVAVRDFKGLTGELTIEKPQLWCPEAPHLYRLEIDLKADNAVVDSVALDFGVRTV